MAKIYAVAKGKQVGIFENWNECSASVTGFPGAIYKSFSNYDEAIEFLKIYGINVKIITPNTNLKPKENITVNRSILASNGIYRVYTDGGCDVNPGGRGGYGCVILTPDGKEIQLSGGYLSSTNNRMEIMAVIAALKAIKELSKIELYSDSQYVIKTMKGEYSKGKNTDLWAKLDEQVKRHKSINWVWVKGHNGNKYNEICDELATKAMESSDLIKDEGYIGLTEEKEKKKSYNFANINESNNSMKVHIDVPYEQYVFSKEKIEEEAKQRGCNKDCIYSIRIFYKKDNPSFKDYAELKTYGKDELSLIKTEEEFINLIGFEKYDYLKDYFENEKDRFSAARWIARGLTTCNAIRKVLVDKEIVQNINKN